ncbi:TetR/AcrR family transcriptional regulator [Rhodoblastus sp.]|uniref:TetR/AcrR family transcriptional regulator n=1 Tax=Rhodoblastus sp. TaxID=1962975 RepID=UPI003F9D80B2
MQRVALVDAAERIIAAHGLQGLKARDLANAVGCSLGGVYNLVGDLDDLILHVASRTLRSLNQALIAADCSGLSPEAQLSAIAIAYCRFARANRLLWRALFEHRMGADKTLPDWAINDQLELFAHVAAPLRRLAPHAEAESLTLMSRTLFSAVHGIVWIGLDEKLVAVPVDALEGQIDRLVRAACRGLAAEEVPNPQHAVCLAKGRRRRQSQPH